MAGEWFTAAQLAKMKLPGLSTNKGTIIEQAKREGWLRRPHKGRGGGWEYHISNLPPAAQVEIIRRWAISKGARLSADERRKIGLPDPDAPQRAQLAGLAKFPHLDDKSRCRAEAREDVLRLLHQFQEASYLGAMASRAAFVGLYNSGEIATGADTRAVVPRLSTPTIQRWQRLFREAGIAGLAGNYGNRRGACVVEANVKIRNLVIAMLVEHPHCSAKHVMEALRARKNDFDGALIPSYRTVQRFIKCWKRDNHQIHLAITNPDAWRSKYQSAAGSASEDVHRLNQRWELDSTPADVLLADGKRYNIVGVIDIYSRRLKLLVSRTSRATAIVALMRRAMLDWGVPETVKTDNGSDYVSKHMIRVLAALRIEQRLCRPFTPESKPHIERALGTFSHGLVELLPGYIGHDVAGRKDIEARRSFAARLGRRDEVVELSLRPSALQDFCDRWADNVYHHNGHGGLGGKSPFQVAAAWSEPIRVIEDERALDVLLSQSASDGGWRTVTKQGIRVEGAAYSHAALGGLEGQRVRALLDETDFGRIYVFADDGAFICRGNCPERVGISREEVAAGRKARQRRVVAEGKKALKKIAREAGVRDITSDILNARADGAAKLERMPARSIRHATPDLDEAGEATKPEPAPMEIPMTEDQRKYHDALELQHLKQSSNPVVRLPETPKDRFKRALATEATMGAGAAPATDDLLWLGGYRETPEFRAQKKIYEDFGEVWLNG